MKPFHKMFPEVTSILTEWKASTQNSTMTQTAAFAKSTTSLLYVHRGGMFCTAKHECGCPKFGYCFTGSNAFNGLAQFSRRGLLLHRKTSHGPRGCLGSVSYFRGRFVASVNGMPFAVGRPPSCSRILPLLLPLFGEWFESIREAAHLHR